MQHEAAKHHQMQTGQSRRKSLVVADQASKACGPGKRALNDPATLPPDAVFCFRVVAIVLSFRDSLV